MHEKANTHASVLLFIAYSQDSATAPWFEVFRRSTAQFGTSRGDFLPLAPISLSETVQRFRIGKWLHETNAYIWTAVSLVTCRRMRGTLVTARSIECCWNLCSNRSSAPVQHRCGTLVDLTMRLTSHALIWRPKAPPSNRSEFDLHCSLFCMLIITWIRAFVTLIENV
jgi:hypothetical protein